MPRPCSAPATRAVPGTSPRRSSTRVRASSTRSAACSATPARSRALPISVQSTGMGCPTAGIVYEELDPAGGDADRPRRHVRCASPMACAMADTVIAISATADDTTALQYADMARLRADARRSRWPRRRRDSVASRCRGARRADRHVRRSSTTPTQANVARWKRPRPPRHRDGSGDALRGGCRARRRGAGDDDRQRHHQRLGEESERISDDELKRGVDAMMRLACRGRASS